MKRWGMGIRRIQIQLRADWLVCRDRLGGEPEKLDWRRRKGDTSCP